MFLYDQVQGWGKTDPLACFQLQNQAKECTAHETPNNCQFCLDMLQSTDNSIGQEAKTTRNQSKSEGELSVGAIDDTASEEITTHSSKSVVLQHTALKWKYITTSYTFQTFLGEMKNPPIKRTWTWNLEDVKNPDAVRHKEINVLDPNGSESLSFHKYFHL